MGEERSVHSLPPFGKDMRTCWVIDHPAHFQLFRQWFCDDDILVVTKRQELDIMLEAGFEQPILRVNRVMGGWFRKISLARQREGAVRRFLAKHPVTRIVSKGAPFELRAAAKQKVPERWYLTDTEVNTIAHRLGAKVATHILLPESWEGVLKPTQTYPGILPMAYIDSSTSLEAWNSAKGQIVEELSLPETDLVVFHRKITGDGIHDGPEVINYDASIRKMNVHFVENKESAAVADGSAWDFPLHAALFDGVLTGSTTLAAEAVVQGVPTLLISKANRGFLTYLENQPHFFHWNDSDLFDGRFAKMAAEWKLSMHSARSAGRNPINDVGTSEVLNTLFGQPF